MPTVVRVNGRTSTPGQATVSALDHGFLYGNGLFETMRATNGRPFALDRHLRRLGDSAEVIGLPLPDSDWLADDIASALSDAGEADAYVRLTVSRGPGAPGPDPTTCEAPTVATVVKPFPAAPERWWTKGIQVWLSRIRRSSESPLPKLKSLNYMECILAKQGAKGAGADEAMLLDTDGHIAEATAWNVFFVRNGMLHTPSERGPILPGITREIVLELAAEASVRCDVGTYTPLQLSLADEAFLTNSLYGIMPMGAFDGAAFGETPPGRVTLQFVELYEARRCAECGC